MKILIATDGSDFSRKAVEKCCEFIQPENGAEIKIISLVERVHPMAAEPFAISEEYYLAVEAGLRKEAGKAVAEAEKIVAEKFGSKTVSIDAEVFTGDVKRTIIDVAENFKPDLMVVGSHGYGFFNRMLLGSVSDFVVHHAPCSVLVVRTENDGGEKE
jgi:nucleotide-binding universal stress UspA family protein